MAGDACSFCGKRRETDAASVPGRRVRAALVARSRLILLLPLLAACRGPTPGVLVGESAHFRLFVDPALTDVPSYQQGQEGIDALETDWSDKASMLKTPDGKIDYYLLTPADVSAACSFPESVDADSGCTWPTTLEIDAAQLPHQHELMHAYMDLLDPGHTPLSMIAEGAAQSLGCSTFQGTPFDDDSAWQQVVLETPAVSDQVYDQGGLLARYLIRTQGIDAWVRYYRQAPELRDPALFAANFQAFWGMTIDAVWAAMHVPPAGSVDMDEPICPCSLPALVADGQIVPYDVDTTPYWTLPSSGAQAIAVAPLGSSYEVVLEDCAGVTPTIRAPFGVPLIADLQSMAGLYLEPVAGGTMGAYVSDDCASTTPYAVPAELLNSEGAVQFDVTRTSSGAMTVYFQVQVPAPAKLQIGPLTEVCDSCAFDQGNCQPTPGTGATVPVQGTFYVRYTYGSVQPYDPNPDVVEGGVQFTN
jgi:hypothetical protein